MEKIKNNESKAVSTGGSVDQAGPHHSLGTPSSPDPWVLRLAEIEEAARDWVTKFQPRILIALTSFVERAIELSNLAHKSFTQRLGKVCTGGSECSRW